MGVFKASVIDAMDCVTNLCEAINNIDGSVVWADKFPPREAMWALLEETINHFHREGVCLEDLGAATVEAGWDENRLEVVLGKVKIK
jgi:hypothetical protein